MPNFLKSVATKPGHRPFRVLMPIFPTTTVTSRHDARLGSTTHCALRASRINYNLTNLSRCSSFLFPIWTYAAPCRPAHFLSNSFQCFLVILQALSLSAKITKLPSFLVTLQALCLFLPKSQNLSHNQITNHTCNATATYSHMQLSRCHLFFHAYHDCQEPYRLHLPNLSHSNG